MLKTLNQINDEFQLIAENHRQINNYYWGDFLSAMKREDENGRRLYKYLVVTPTSTAHSMDSTSLSLLITVCDKQLKNNDDRDDIHSDCVQILNDIFTTFLEDRWQEFCDVSTASTNLFIEKSLDAVAGAVMNVTLQIYSEDNACAIPYINPIPLEPNP